MADAGITNNVNKRFGNDLEALFEAGERATELVNHPGWAEVQALLADEVAGLDAALERSKPLEQAEYAMLVGRRAGLLSAKRYADTIVRIAHEKYLEQQKKHEAGGESPA